MVTYPDPFAKQEAEGLAEAAGYQVVQTITQKYLLHAEYGVGSGKAEELRNVARQVGSETVLVDEGLTSSQMHNLAKLTAQKVYDRERLILDIFAKRATTAEAKLQVRLAELKYELPRVRGEARLNAKSEQPGFSGMGEYSVDVKFRDLKRRISFITGKLRQATQRRSLHRAQRSRLNMPLVSLAGYTGSGKTTLFNRLAAEEKEVARSLFTTLTTTSRAVKLPDATRILLSDTVGFISRLPTYMIEAFKSTLEELGYAHLILLMLDVSEPLPYMKIRYDSCRQTLKELDTDAAKVIVVLNKADLASAEQISQAKTLCNESPYAVVSAKRGDGTHVLKSLLQRRLRESGSHSAEVARRKAVRSGDLETGLPKSLCEE